MFPTMALSVSVLVGEHTPIEFLSCRDGNTEFTFDEELVMETTEPGLRKLVEVVNAALRDREARKAGQT